MRFTSLIILTIFLAVALAVEEPKIDYSKVLPRQEVPGFWAGRKIRPINDFHHKFDRASRIVGGDEVKPNAHPYQVGLLINVMWWTSLCGGCLLSENVVITAAHCLQDSTSAQAVMGAHIIFTVEPTQVRKTVRTDGYIMHPDYDPVMLYNDISLLLLPSKVVFTPYIQPIQLPHGDLLEKKFTGEMATVSGWGRTSDQRYERFSSAIINRLDQYSFQWCNFSCFALHTK
jgi:secreted trypsin-like serine protease